MSSVPSRGELYDWEQRHVIGRDTEDAPFYIELMPSGARVLELGCGTGRLARPLAAAGATVVGIDIDAEMLDVARRHGGVALVQADMRRFAFGCHFDLVVAAYNGLQLLLDADDRAACVRAVADHLAPDGAFVFELHDFVAEVEADVEPTPLHAGVVGDTAVTLHGGLRCDRARRVTTYTRRFEASGTTIEDDVSLYSFASGEVDALLRDAGLHGRSVAVSTTVERWVARRIGHPLDAGG